MRLWSVHPRYLDRQALIAGWREGLLAQAVILAPGRGYHKHPQLERFKAHPDPLAAVKTFLEGLADEADTRGYRFDRGRLADTPSIIGRLALTDGQLLYEWRHLTGRMAKRSPEVAERWKDVTMPDPHPLFTVVRGPIADWERPSPPAA